MPVVSLAELGRIHSNVEKLSEDNQCRKDGPNIDSYSCVVRSPGQYCIFLFGVKVQCLYDWRTGVKIWKTGTSEGVKDTYHWGL